MRVPMQWDEVAEQRRDHDSLLRFMTRLVHHRHDTPELGWGESRLIENEPPALFAHRCDWQGSTVFAIHNLCDETVTAELDLGDDVERRRRPARAARPRVEGGRLHVELGAYGYLWLRARGH